MEGQLAGPLAQPTRARLFAAIRDLGGEATTDELARELGLHVNGVRRHLDLMQEAGLLARARRKHGRGRPRDVWSIAPAAAGADRPEEDYADLACWLARAIPAAPAALRAVEETGREVGRELAADRDEDLPEGIERAFAALGFQPVVRTEEGGTVTCELTNCPYRASVRENPDAVCRLHRGITEGLLERLAPGSRLTRFEPHDPDEAGCIVEAVAATAR
jgi:predicted ArsR family transcriptional regulator